MKKVFDDRLKTKISKRNRSYIYLPQYVIHLQTKTVKSKSYYEYS